MENQQFMAVSRFDGKKAPMKWETLATEVKAEFKRYGYPFFIATYMTNLSIQQFL